MSQPASTYNAATRKANLAIIHVALGKLKIKDADYRLLLSATFGVLSAQFLTQMQHNQLIGIFEDRGFRRFTKTPAELPGQPKFGKGCEAMGKKVGAMLAQAGRDWAYAHGVAKRMFKCDRIEWLSGTQLHAVTSALSIDQKRRSKPTAAHPKGAA